MNISQNGSPQNALNNTVGVNLSSLMPKSKPAKGGKTNTIKTASVSIGIPKPNSQVKNYMSNTPVNKSQMKVTKITKGSPLRQTTTTTGKRSVLQTSHNSARSNTSTISQPGPRQQQAPKINNFVSED